MYETTSDLEVQHLKLFISCSHAPGALLILLFANTSHAGLYQVSKQLAVF